METRRLLFAALLSLIVLLVWQALFPPPVPVEEAVEEPERPGVEEAAVPDALEGEQVAEARESRGEAEAGGDGDEVQGQSPEEAAPSVPVEPLAGLGGERRRLETESWVATFDSTGARLVSLELLERRDAQGEPVELVRRRGEDAPLPFSLVDEKGRRLDLDDAPFAVVESGQNRLVFGYRGGEGVATKEFSVDEEGLLVYEIRVESPEAWSVWFGPGVANPRWEDLDDRMRRGSRRASVMAEELESQQTSKLEETQRISGSGVTWFSLENKYFLMALAPRQRVEEVALVPVRLEGGEEEGIRGFVIASEDIQAEGPVDAALVVTPTSEALSGVSYWGAKEYTRLRALPFDFEKTVRFGVFGFLARPLLYGLRWIHSTVTSNWGWSIVLMTVAINLILFPLRHKSFISMQRMQKLNPRMEAIRNRYRPKLRDKQGRPNLEMQRKMNEEIQGMFKEEGVNPAMGCLPLLLQMPVFFAFYRLLAEAVELQGAPWVGWITDLSVPDPLKALPLLMGATQFLQTKTMPPAANPTQRILMNTMPIWFTLFAFAFPAGLVLYWLTNNVLTIIQQAGYNRLKKAGYFGGVPEDTKKDRKAPKQQKKAKSGSA